MVAKQGTAKQGLARVEEYATYCYFGEAHAVNTEDDFLSARKRKSRRIPWDSLLRRGTHSLPADRPGLVYPIQIDVEERRIVGAGRTLAERIEDGELAEADLTVWEPDRSPGTAWPTRRNGSLGTWQVNPARLMWLLEHGYVRLGRYNEGRTSWAISYLKSGSIKKVDKGELVVEGRESEGGPVLLEWAEDAGKRVRAKTVWNREAHNAGTFGSTVLRAFLGQRLFDFPKSIYAVADVLATILRDSPDAVVLDFFAGSGTTLHSVALLNEQDGGSRQSILVTNNDLSDEDARALHKKGRFAGDPEYEAKGIFRAVAKPRIEASLTGTRPDGEPAEGSYLSDYLDGHEYEDGFEENVDFFELEYLEHDVVALGHEYDRLAPLLWLQAGAKGDWEPKSEGAPWSIPSSSTYAVLFDPGSLLDFVREIDKREAISHVWVETDSQTVYRALRSLLPDHVKHVGALYSDYLRHVVERPKMALR